MENPFLRKAASLQASFLDMPSVNCFTEKQAIDYFQFRYDQLFTTVAEVSPVVIPYVSVNPAPAVAVSETVEIQPALETSPVFKPYVSVNPAPPAAVPETVEIQPALETSPVFKPYVSVNPAPPAAVPETVEIQPALETSPVFKPYVSVNPAPPAAVPETVGIQPELEASPVFKPYVSVNPAPPSAVTEVVPIQPALETSPVFKPYLSVNPAPPAAVSDIAQIAEPFLNPVLTGIPNILVDDPFICHFAAVVSRPYDVDLASIVYQNEQSMQDSSAVFDIGVSDFLEEGQSFGSLFFDEGLETAKQSATDNILFYESVLIAPEIELVADQIIVE